MRGGHRFCLFSEMNFAFITKFNKMTYEYYLKLQIDARMEII